MPAPIRFKRVVASEWKRRRDGDVVCEERPHIVATDLEAESFLDSVRFMGCGVPVGWVKVNGTWMTGLRFIALPSDSATLTIANLQFMIRDFFGCFGSLRCNNKELRYQEFPA